MRDFVPDDDADAAVVERLGEMLAVEQGLKDPGGENWKDQLTGMYRKSGV